MSPIIDIGMEFNAAHELGTKEFEPLPDGPYNLRVTKCEPGTSRAGNPKLSFEMDVFDHPNPENNKRKVFHSCPLPSNGNTKGIGLLTTCLAALKAQWDATTFETESLLGRECQVNLKTKQFEGKSYNYIDSFI